MIFKVLIIVIIITDLSSPTDWALLLFPDLIHSFSSFG